LGHEEGERERIDGMKDVEMRGRDVEVHGNV
jgi:hypothetical protein